MGKEFYPHVKLDDPENTVTFSDGKYKHFLGKPSKELLMERESRISHEIPLAKDGTVIEDDGFELDELDAEMYERTKTKDPVGYPAKVPLIHKARAFRQQYARTFEVPEGTDMFADVIPVHEIYGDPSAPKQVVIHLITNPEDKEQRKMLVAINKRERKPDKRGRDKIVVPSYLQKAIDFYVKYFAGIENATITISEEVEEDAGVVNTTNQLPESISPEPNMPVDIAQESQSIVTREVEYSKDLKEQFLEQIDPLIMRMVVKTLCESIDDASRD